MKKDWDEQIPGGFPIGLAMHPTGANRMQRRMSREHKNDPTPPSSMRPFVKRLNKETHEVEYVAER